MSEGEGKNNADAVLLPADVQAHALAFVAVIWVFLTTETAEKRFCYPASHQLEDRDGAMGAFAYFVILCAWSLLSRFRWSCSSY